MEGTMISICLTNYNRTDSLMRSFYKVWEDERINEIVIVDDCSSEETTNYLLEHLFGKPKISIYLNNENIGMSQNKARAISLATNDWCIILDSDNILDKTYLDQLFRLQWQDDTIYAPDFARPNFNFQEYSGRQFSKHNLKRWAKTRNWELIMNTCNYFVNKNEYAKVYQFNPEMKGTDTAWFNYLWFQAGNKFQVVRGMQYEHTVHDESEFVKHMDYNMRMSTELRLMMLNL